MATRITQSDVEAIYDIIAPRVRMTPVLSTNAAEFGLAAFPLTLKLEQLQVAGSFKARGAFATMLSREIPAAGVVTASLGNHGAAVAHAARSVGCPARIFIPTQASAAKVARITRFGADLCVTGAGYADALAASEAWAAQSGALSVHAFNQRETVLGQATIGLELSRQAGDIDTLLVAIGGGGLIAGIASWYAGRIRVVGVEPRSAPTMYEALRAGRPVDAPAGGIAADSLAPRRVGEFVFPIVRSRVDRVVLVGDEDIRRAQNTLWEAARIVAEPGGATAFAALEGGAYRPRPDERVAVLISGGNTDAVDFARASSPGIAADAAQRRPAAS